MIVFFYGPSEHASGACREGIDRGGKRKRERGEKAESADRRVCRSEFIARASVPLRLLPSKSTPCSAEWHDLFLQTAGAN